MCLLVRVNFFLCNSALRGSHCQAWHRLTIRWFFKKVHTFFFFPKPKTGKKIIIRSAQLEKLHYLISFEKHHSYSHQDTNLQELAQIF